MPTQRYPGYALRIFLGLAAAIAVSGTAYLCAWYELRCFYYFVEAQDWTKQKLNELREEIENFRKATGHLPTTLADLDIVKAKRMWVDDVGQVVDGWQHPYQYRIEGDTYLLYSYGQDGRPGGVGLDADLYAGDESQADEFLTLWQFTTDVLTDDIKKSCIVAGVCAFALCLIGGIEQKNGRRPSISTLLVRNSLTLVFCLIAALVMCSFAIPNGH